MEIYFFSVGGGKRNRKSYSRVDGRERARIKIV